MQGLKQRRHLLRFAVGLLAIFLAIAVFPVSQGRATAATGTTMTFSNQTSNAFASSDQPWTDNGPTIGGINTDVGVFQSGSGAGAQTMLFYSVYTFESDPIAGWQWVPLANGFGTIPNGAVQFSGGAKLTSATINVNVDALNNSSFQHWGPGGLVSLRWTASPYWSNSNSGGSRSTSGFGGQSITTTSGGSSYNSSAEVQGSVVGYSLPNLGANNYSALGSSQGVTVCRGCQPPPGP
jgi:hypothetical protein